MPKSTNPLALVLAAGMLLTLWVPTLAAPASAGPTVLASLA